MAEAKYYNAPTAIKDVPGVAMKKGEWWTDFYSGTAEALIAAGLATPDEFPGQPGRPKSSVAYRLAAGKQGAHRWDRAPGYRIITRVGGGFRIDITASHEEHERRVEKEWADRAAAKKAAPRHAEPVTAAKFLPPSHAPANRVARHCGGL